MPKSVFIIDRKLDYTVTQRFAVPADSLDEATEKVSEFSNSSDWSPAAAVSHGVVQISDQMEQIENSEEIEETEDKFVHNPPVLDESMRKMILSEQADAMFALLLKIRNYPQMFWASHSELGHEAKSLTEQIEASLSDCQATLTTVLSQ